MPTAEGMWRRLGGEMLPRRTVNPAGETVIITDTLLLGALARDAMPASERRVFDARWQRCPLKDRQRTQAAMVAAARAIGIDAMGIVN
jgi:hypothetical protein